MLRDFRIQALSTIADVRACMATSGPGGLQASVVCCSVRGESLYLSLPASSDHLFNLEHTFELLLTTERWQLRGLALPRHQHVGLSGPRDLVAQAQQVGHVLIEVVPLQLHLGPAGALHYCETVDFSASSHLAVAGGRE